MNAFGLTGNIGCGKSTVAKILAMYHDVAVFDCDKIAKALVASFAHRATVERILGANVFSAAGVDFKAIAKIIFRDKEKKKQLEEFIHPLVWNAAQREIAKLEDWQITIVESAILYESGLGNQFLGMIVAVCNEAEQLRRLRELRNMNDEDISARRATQLSAAEKEKRAQFVIRTDCSMAGLKRNVSTLYWQLKRWKK